MSANLRVLYNTKNDFPDPVAGKGEAIVDIEYCDVNHSYIRTR